MEISLKAELVVFLVFVTIGHLFDGFFTPTIGYIKILPLVTAGLANLVGVSVVVIGVVRLQVEAPAVVGS